MQHCDIVIIGGGLVGAALARALSKNNIACVIIDNQPESALYSVALDNRGIVLSYSSAQILQDLQVWQQLLPKAHKIATVHVSEQNAFGFTKLNSRQFNIPALGYVLSASDLGMALIKDLGAVNNVSVMRPVEIKDVSYDSNSMQWSIFLPDQKLTAKLLIAADGSNSFLRQRMNIAATSIDYQQSAIVTNITMTSAITDAAYERFTAQGVLALLPFGEKQYKCVWTVDNALLPELQNLSEQEYLQRVQQAFGYKIGKMLTINVRKIFPIQQMQAQKLYANGVVLLGNAANTLHPVAAQGLNLGFRDIMCLTKILKRATLKNTSLNDNSLLTEFAEDRSADHNNTQRYTNSLVEIFASQNSFVKIARKLGLLAAQFVPALNRRIVSQGLGTWTS